MLKKLLYFVRRPDALFRKLFSKRDANADKYIRHAPSPQNALSIFAGQWWSHLPAPWDRFTSGRMPLYADPRIKWAIEALGGVAGQSVLELGPLEGGHTWMLEQAGARSIVAVEGDAHSYLRCLIAKEIVGLQHGRFLLGDFEEYLRIAEERFDVAIACGVLYHVRHPVELIHNLARITGRVYIWTHYYDRERIARIEHMAHRIGEGVPAEYGGFRHTVYRYEYGDFLWTARFAGGSAEFSHWLSRDDLLGALRHAGFTDIRIGEEEPEHVNGPAISLVASRP